MNLPRLKCQRNFMEVKYAVEELFPPFSLMVNIEAFRFDDRRTFSERLYIEVLDSELWETPDEIVLIKTLIDIYHRL